MMTVCPVCGKNTCIHWPEHWVYRRGPTYYCSDNCMQISINRDKRLLDAVLLKKRKGKIMSKPVKITEGQKKKAVEIAISGGNPLPFLKECGSEKPSAMWWYIKKCVKEKDPETFAKLPKRVDLKQAETPEGDWIPAREVYGEAPEATVKVDGPIRIHTETPEKVKVETPAKAPEHRWTGVETAVGNFQYFRKQGYLDFTPVRELDITSMKVEEWKELLKILPWVMDVLGVEA